MESIVACEGGELDVMTTKDGDTIIEMAPAIPPLLWCDNCKKRIICKSKLMARWSKRS